MTVSQGLLEAGYAVAIGLVVGFEREHHEVSAELEPTEVPDEKDPALKQAQSPLGARSFALIALAGWLLAFLGDRWAAVLPVGLVVIAALIVVQYGIAARGGKDPGITTEAAALVVALLGALVHADRALAVSIALGVVLLLISKPWMRGAVVKLRRLEITATVQLLVLVAIVLPMLPVEPVDPWDAIPPRKVGIFVVLIAAVEYVGYILHRLLGAKRGAALAGLVGGLTSSTAVTAAMARQARKSPAMVAPGQLATFLANVVMGVRVVVVSAFLSPEVAMRLVWPMVALVAVLGGGALWRMRRADDGAADAPPMTLRNPFALVPALTWGVILCAVLLIAHFATEYLGQYGLVLAAAASGMADVDAIILAAGRQAGELAITADTAALSIAVAVAANMVVKGGIAVGAGGRAYGKSVALVFAIAVLAAGVVTAAGLIYATS